MITINQTLGAPARLESEIIEALIPDHFNLQKTGVHGFPFKEWCNIQPKSKKKPNALQNRDLSKVRPNPIFDNRIRVALLIVSLLIIYQSDGGTVYVQQAKKNPIEVETIGRKTCRCTSVIQTRIIVSEDLIIYKKRLTEFFFI